MNKQEYSTAIKKTPFKYIISRKIGGLIKDGLFYQDIYKKCYENNYIEIESKQRRKEVLNVVYTRLSLLDSFLINAFVNDSISTSKFILVYAIAKSDKLFSEFLLTVYRDALIGDKKYILMNDFDNFFILEKEKNLSVSKWSDSTIRDLGKSYRNILVESGLCIKNKKKFIPQNIIINPIVIEYIKNIGDIAYLQAILGVK